MMPMLDPCCSSNNVNSGGVGAEGVGEVGEEGGGGGRVRGGQSRSVSNSVKGVRHSSHVETKVRDRVTDKAAVLSKKKRCTYITLSSSAFITTD